MDPNRKRAKISIISQRFSFLSGRRRRPARMPTARQRRLVRQGPHRTRRLRLPERGRSVTLFGRVALCRLDRAQHARDASAAVVVPPDVSSAVVVLSFYK